ncbi:leucine-rich repeat domain-containing protein, partial [Treponema pedis]|uniref:leucine-rich repeat domain-containing protein n=1 Tax=Treponema pedis TaxID=409322 RepID=UPI000466C9AF
LTSLNVQGCTALTYLYCSDNQLSSLNVQGCTALTYLYCNNNQLNSLNVQGLTALRKVGCRNNKITSLNVQDCTALEWLSCDNNKLNEEAFILLFTDLPSRSSYSIKGTCYLYREADPTEGNCTDFTLSPALQAAFNNAKAKNWKMYKFIDSGVGAEI